MQLQQAELQEAVAKHGFAEARLRAICKTHEGPEALAQAKVCEKTCSEDWEKHDTLLSAILRRQAQIGSPSISKPQNTLTVPSKKSNHMVVKLGLLLTRAHLFMFWKH